MFSQIPAWWFQVFSHSEKPCWKEEAHDQLPVTRWGISYGISHRSESADFQGARPHKEAWCNHTGLLLVEGTRDDKGMNTAGDQHTENHLGAEYVTTIYIYIYIIVEIIITTRIVMIIVMVIIMITTTTTTITITIIIIIIVIIIIISSSFLPC